MLQYYTMKLTKKGECMKRYKKIQKITIFIILFIAIIFTSGCQSENLKEVKN